MPNNLFDFNAVYYHRGNFSQRGVTTYYVDFYEPINRRFQNKRFHKKLSVSQQYSSQASGRQGLHQTIDITLDITDILHGKIGDIETKELFDKIFEKKAKDEKPSHFKISCPQVIKELDGETLLKYILENLK